MKNVYCRLTLVTAMLPLIVGGCAMQGVQGGASAESARPVASAPQVIAAAPQPAVVAPHAAKQVPQLPQPSALETQYGIQITQIGLTASGGLVDVRFKILDAVKARTLLGNPANAPMLIAGDKPPLMAPHSAMRGARFSQGQVFYILYPNLRSAIKPGVEVTVAMGEARLGPVTAQ